ncbi:DUF262 domain-containing protein [Elizabethkingia anophelis]|uniref:DUF262 domain-containing protein n=1 Tax=Elizabethkingia anophelis TaxID=1117645 RepID=UPI0038926F7D
MDKIKIEQSEQQIYNLRKTVRYDIRELTIEIIVNKYLKGKNYDSEVKDENVDFYNCIFVPEYQRDFTWDNIRQSRFIESVILGLPIPLIFVAENKDSAWEIVDGSQRVRTLNAFLSNKLQLDSLDKLDTLNGFCFSDLDKSRQGKIKDTPIRMIVLSEDADDQVKKDMFERINRGSDLLKPMEKRKGIYLGEFRDFIYDKCANEELLSKLAPIDKWLINRQEREELILRFFAFSDGYSNYPNNTGVSKYLDEYLDKKNKELAKLNPEKRKQKLDNYYEQFISTLTFVDNYSEYGFRRTHNPQTKRVIFEAIAVGANSALKINPNVTFSKRKMQDLLNSKTFIDFTSGNVGNKKAYSKEQVIGRIDFIKNGILAK